MRAKDGERATRGQTNQKRRDFLWFPVLQRDSVHLPQLITFVDQTFKRYKIPSGFCKYHELTLIIEFISSPLLSAGPPLMILATTMAPVDLSLFIVAP